MSGNSSERFVAAVDFGTKKTALAVAKVEGSNTQVLFYKTAPSAGIMHSAIAGVLKVEAVLKGLIEEAEKDLNIKISQVVTGLPRCFIRQQDATGTVERSNPDDCITEDEIENLKSLAQDSGEEADSSNERIYGIVAQSFSTGDYFQLIENDVVGMTGDELTGHFKVFIGKKRPISNMTKVFNDLGLAVCRTYFTPAATAKAVLTEEERSNGVALIDLGAGTTSVSIFTKKVLAAYGAVPFGGNTITGDIRSECGISEELAENIKMAYGGCMPDKLLNLGEKILQIETDDMSAYKQIPVTYLSEIITARVKEIADAMLWHIQQSGLQNELRKGIVITGGGAEMLNLANYLRDLSGYNVRVAYPRRGFVASGAEDILKSDAATIAGLILNGRDDNVNCCIESEGYAAGKPEQAKEPERLDAVEIPVEEKADAGAGEVKPETPAVAAETEVGAAVPEAKPSEECPEPEEKPAPKPADAPKEKKKKGFIWKFIGKVSDTVNGAYENATSEINNEEV